MRAFLAALCAFFAAPALADEPLAVTPSGSTEAYFDMNLVETSDLLSNKCMDAGWTTINSSETVVVCELPVSFGNRLLSALAGPRYATPPRQFIRFNLAGFNGYARVQASGWQEIQTAFGQTQRTELASENYHNGVTGFLIGIGGIYPPGTQFPNHAAMEAEYEFIEVPRKGMRLKSVAPDGPFASAGLQSGDIVTRLARERIKDVNDLSDGLHKAIDDQTFEVEIYRGSERLKIIVPRVFRTSAGPLPVREIVQDDTPLMATTIVQQEFSIAEELERLANLKDRGILTDEEFAQQKSKLLSR